MDGLAVEQQSSEEQSDVMVDSAFQFGAVQDDVAEHFGQSQADEQESSEQQDGVMVDSASQFGVVQDDVVEHFGQKQADEQESSEEQDDVTLDDDGQKLGDKECARCGRVHDMKDREEFRRARRKPPCRRCGLMHSDYDVTSRIYGYDIFDCEVIFPNIDDLVMNGRSILLPTHIWQRDRATEQVAKVDESD